LIRRKRRRERGEEGGAIVVVVGGEDYGCSTITAYEIAGGYVFASSDS